MPLSNIRQYTKAELGDTVIITGATLPEDNGSGTIMATGSGLFGWPGTVYQIRRDKDGSEVWHSRHHFHLSAKPNREEMSEEERYTYNLKHHGRGTTEIL